MNRAKLTAAAAVALIIGLAIGYEFALRGAMDDVQRNESSDGREVLYWHDPMVPGARFDRPGKSPFMDMQLVPVYADRDAGADVRIDPRVVQNLGVRTGRVERKALPHRFEAVGSVAFDERLLEVVQARVEGYITRLYVKAPLTRVRKGQPLAEILAPEWLAAQQDYIALLDAQSASAQSVRDAARQRLAVLGVPEAAILALETQRKASPATTTIFAPIDGVVTELAVREGAAFASGAPLLRINGLSTIWVNAQVPESRVSLVTVGSDVRAQAVAWPGVTFKGEVIALLPEVDPQTRTLTARLAIENPQQKLAPGMFVSLEFPQPDAAPRLVVPSEAVIMTGERSIVIVARGDGAFDVAEVTVGAERDGMSAILSGLQEGQSVVLSGQFLIDSEASLGATLDRLSGADPAGNGAAEPRPQP